MKLAACLFAALLLATSARAHLCRGWSTQDAVLQAAGAALILTDWAQTRKFTAARVRTRCTSTTTTTDTTRTTARRCERDDAAQETNPALGRHPDPAAVNAYFAGMAALHLAVSCIAPEHRSLWQSFMIGLEANQVWHNYRVGVRVSASW